MHKGPCLHEKHDWPSALFFFDPRLGNRLYSTYEE